MNRNEAPERTPAAPVYPSDPFDALVDIADGLLASVKAPLNAATVNSLCLVFGQTAVLSALDLIDHDEVTRVLIPNGTYIYRVSGSDKVYTVYPQIGYCPCPAFAHSVLLPRAQSLCKHLLACRLAAQLGRYRDKELDDGWVASWSQNFAFKPAT